MLEVILEGQRVFLAHNVVDIAVDLGSVELRALTEKLDLTPRRGWIADKELTAGQLGLQQGHRYRIDGGRSRKSDCGEHRLQSCRGPVAGQAKRSEVGGLRVELVAVARVLVAGVKEEP